MIPKNIIKADPDWYRKVKPKEIWTKRTANKQLHDTVKIIKVVNLKNKKYVKVELPNGIHMDAEPGWLFYNYEKGIQK